MDRKNLDKDLSNQKKALLDPLFKMPTVDGKSVEEDHNFPKTQCVITYIKDMGVPKSMEPPQGHVHRYPYVRVRFVQLKLLRFCSERVSVLLHTSLYKTNLFYGRGWDCPRCRGIYRCRFPLFFLFSDLKMSLKISSLYAKGLSDQSKAAHLHMKSCRLVWRPPYPGNSLIFATLMLVCCLKTFLVYSEYGIRKARGVSFLVKYILDARVSLVHVDDLDRLIVADIAVRSSSLRFMRPTTGRIVSRFFSSRGRSW